MFTRTNAKACVLTVLEIALKERFKYPDSDLKNDATFITELAERVELAAYSGMVLSEQSNISKTGSDIDTQFDISERSSAVVDEEATFEIYISYVAKFLVHISPAFYSGRHSFLFRDMLVDKKIEPDIVYSDEGEIWPEMFGDNDYLDPLEREQIMITRAVEQYIAVKGLVTLIDRCCASDKCTLEQQLSQIKKDRIFEEGSAFTESRNYVCFGKGQGCWMDQSNKIILPCDNSDAVCNRIPMESKQVYHDMNAMHYFTDCVMYEEFLKEFALEYFDDIFEIADPTAKGKNIEQDIALDLRKKYLKEIKMMRYYLDIIQEGQNIF